MSRRYDHVDLRVSNLAIARSFYEVLLPALGFTRNDSNEKWFEYEYEDGEAITDYFAITEVRDHVPNQNRIAFWADSIEEVDKLSKIVVTAGGRNVEGPGFEGKDHYAVFFEDPCGNRFEICHRTGN
jgi:catechol 2,3-dioxygenase-like lactoylglutathione lyase family enzyme